MTNAYIPARERVELSCLEEVELAWMEKGRGDCQITLDPALSRICELGIAKGDHYLQISGYLGDVSMLAFQLSGASLESKKIRQAILTRGMLVRHYLADLESGEMLFIEREISVRTGTTTALIDPMTPPLVGTTNNDPSVVRLDYGSEYMHHVLARAAKLKAFASDEAAQQFVTDTNIFLSAESVVHTAPTIASTKHSYPALLYPESS